MVGAGLAKPATLDDVLGLVLLDENAERQKQLDTVISARLKARGYTTLPLSYTSEAGPFESGVINGVSYADIPLEILESTLDLHRLMRKKWQARLADVSEERAAGYQSDRQLNLELLAVWDRYSDNLETALQAAIAKLDKSIKELAEHITARQPV
jgi:hypothetical protein